IKKTFSVVSGFFKVNSTLVRHGNRKAASGHRVNKG
ncbi:unnamed protein product, partial [Allacma fusca]